MKYYSTKDKACARAFSLREAVQAGLAPDGGLFVPERIPQADMAVAERLAGESYAALAGYLAELFFGDVQYVHCIRHSYHLLHPNCTYLLYTLNLFVSSCLGAFYDKICGETA